MNKKFLVLGMVMFSIQIAAADPVTNNITVNGCCNSCSKPKIIVKKVIVEKPIVVEKVVEVEKPTVKILYVDRPVIQKQVVTKKNKKNRISLLGGVGPVGLTQPSSTEIDLVRGPVGGIMYQRLITDRVSLGIQGQTNSTVLGIVGWDF